MVAFLSCNITFLAKRPLNSAYPTELITVGDHLRKTRLNRGLHQKDVAKLIGVSDETINNWENNHTSPQISKMKMIDDFLKSNHVSSETF